MKCYDDAGKDKFLSATTPTRERAWPAAGRGPGLGPGLRREHRAAARHVDTQSAARDMDMLRGVLGDDSSTTSATPTAPSSAPPMRACSRTRRTPGARRGPRHHARLGRGGAPAGGRLESGLRAYVATARRAALPARRRRGERPAEDPGHGRGRKFNPIPTSSGRDLTELAFYGVAVTMYDEASWSFLTQALREVLSEGAGDDLLTWRRLRRRTTTARSSPTAKAPAPSTAPRPRQDNMAKMRDIAAEIQAPPPRRRVVRVLRHRVHRLGVPAGERSSTPPPGRAAIVVIGSSNDPATPYRWAESLADTLSSALLVTYRGRATRRTAGPTAPSTGRQAYLLDGELRKGSPADLGALGSAGSDVTRFALNLARPLVTLGPLTHRSCQDHGAHTT